MDKWLELLITAMLSITLAFITSGAVAFYLARANKRKLESDTDKTDADTTDTRVSTVLNIVNALKQQLEDERIEHELAIEKIKIQSGERVKILEGRVGELEGRVAVLELEKDALNSEKVQLIVENHELREKIEQLREQLRGLDQDPVCGLPEPPM